MEITGSTGAVSEGIHHVKQFGGDIYYVSPGGTDDNSGRSPDSPLLTIGAAIGKLSTGDAINVTAGTYTETSLDLDVANCEIRSEIGAIIDPASGVGLTVSGAYCKVLGEIMITPNAAAGLLVSGDNCVVNDVKVLNGTDCYHITGAGVVLNRCVGGYPSAGNSGFNIQGVQARLRGCSTVGNTTSYGYKINNNVDTGVLDGCTSVGHATSGYYISTGSQDWTLLNCSSGAGDGKWMDTDNANVWSNFTYDDKIYKAMTLDGSTTYNLFKVTGAVRIGDINGHVETAIANTSSSMHLEAYSTGGSVDITDAPGVNIQADVVGTLYVRNEYSTNPIDKAEPDGTPAVAESTNFRDPKTEVDVVEDDANDTYIRAVLSDAVASGVIHWHCVWKPLTEEGFLQPV